MFKGRITEITEPHIYYVSRVRDRLSQYRECSPVESFYIHKDKPCNGSCESVFIRDDIYMLFNQKRLDRMSSAALSSWLQSTSTYDSGLANLRSRMSDSQLGSFIKSRYIQSRSELLSWSGYLESQYPMKSVQVSGPGPDAVPDSASTSASSQAE